MAAPPMQAEVLSLESLVALEAALAKYAGRARDSVAAMRKEFDRRQAALDGEEEAARAETAERLDALRYAEDEDERESCAQQFAEARERLSRIRAWQARSREHHARFLAQTARFDGLLDQTFPRCREFLKARIGELRAYAAIQPEPAAASAAPASRFHPPPPTTSEAAVSSASPKLTEFKLPAGFVWVPLAEIDEAELAGVRSPEDFKKDVSYETMHTGLQRLAAEILPRLDADPDGLDRDSFRSLDEAAGESYEVGLQRVYEAFFCNDHIYLERRRGREKFDITNGRHRIRVALDLGWEAIPARAKDLRS